MSDAPVGSENAGKLVWLVQDYISQGLCRLAVPLFFVISGYLFFAGTDWSMLEYAAKLKKRIKSLLIPYLFWNIFFLSVVAIVEIIPATSVFITAGRTMIYDLSPSELLSLITGLGSNAPMAFQFWFIRDLMLLCIASPLIFIANKYIPYLFLPALFIIWIIGKPSLPMPVNEGILFFSLGCFAAIKNQSLFVLDRFAPFLVVPYLAVLSCDILNVAPAYHNSIHNLGIVTGLVVVIYASKLVYNHGDRLKSALINLAGASFFLFAVHEPMLIIIKKLCYKLVVPQASASILAIYFAAPILVILLTLVIYKFANAKVPAILAFVTGGRKKRPR